VQPSGRVAKALAQGSRALADAAQARGRARERRRANTLDSQPALAHLSLLRAPRVPMTLGPMKSEIRVATYNVHRWAGINGRAKPDVARAGFVISELDADVIALQEVLRPTDRGGDEDPLERLAEALGLHLAFAFTRQHRFGELGNAILSRFPIAAVSVLDISHSRIERRGALAAQFNLPTGSLGVVATHLSLVDRTRQRQVQSLLEHPQWRAGPAVLLGDMNAWRRCKATRELDAALSMHHNLDWPSSFPAAAPVLALDRVYASGADVVEVRSHDTPASRRASDHLPVVARIALKPDVGRQVSDAG
jgi:endonuclease/exonuclease/phosphatase family metal-dependent hydrolase